MNTTDSLKGVSHPAFKAFLKTDVPRNVSIDWPILHLKHRPQLTLEALSGRTNCVEFVEKAINDEGEELKVLHMYNERSQRWICAYESSLSLGVTIESDGRTKSDLLESCQDVIRYFRLELDIYSPEDSEDVEWVSEYVTEGFYEEPNQSERLPLFVMCASN